MQSSNRLFSAFNSSVHDIENGELSSVNCNTKVEETVSLNSTEPINKQASVITTTMKRAKPATSICSNEKNLKSCKKLKAGITLDDSKVGQSKEVNKKRGGKAIIADQTKNLSDVKKKPGKNVKDLELKSPMLTSVTKKAKIKADNGAPKGDLKKITTPMIVEGERDTKFFPIPIVIGLQCKSMTDLESKKTKQLPNENIKKNLEAETTTNLDGKKETEADTNSKRKRGRPFKRQAKSRKTSMPVKGNENGDAISEVNVEKVSNESCEAALTLQHEKYNNKPVTGKRGKRRTISNINIEPSTQDCEDLSKQKENENTEISIKKSPDTMPEDQPLSKWFQGKKHFENSKCPPAVTNGESQKLTFEKRSSLWSTIESTEAFSLIPQTPHFNPLNTLKETARERQAISLMVNFSGVFEDTSRLRVNSPITEIQDQFEKLSEFETHGFNINPIKNRLIELLSVKGKHEKLNTESKEVKGKIEKDNVDGKEFDNEIELIDKQASKLLEKRQWVLKEKEKNDSELAVLEAELDRIEEAKHKARKEFDDLAAALL